MTDLIGQTLLNRYRIAELLGRGGMAQVYKTWDQQRTVFLAMKVLHDDLARDKVFLRRFAREAQILDKLQHPHIVRFYGLEQEGLQAFLLMDYIQGSTLRDEIFQLKRVMTGPRILEVIRPICSALHYAHQMGLVHCDIKPANIMIQSNGNVLVADFGIARLIENSTTTTMAGAGTPAYMSPEQVLGKKPSPQMDVYALGIMLYEMLTGGERPFTGDQAQEGGSTAEKVRWEHLQVKPPSPKEYNPAISRNLERVVLKCLEKDPSQRYASAIELLQALVSAEGTQGFMADTSLIKKRAQSQGYSLPIQEPIDANYERPISQKIIRANSNSRLSMRSVGLLVMGMLVFASFGFIAWIANQGTIQIAAPTPDVIFTSALETARAAVTQTADHETINTPFVTFESAFIINDVTATSLPDKTDAASIFVEAGKFTMGGNMYNSELPIHTIYLSDYYIDQTEVTNGAYKHCVEAGVCDLPKTSNSFTHSVYYGNFEFDDYPVVQVNWDMANTYCAWRGARLPTEAEWEKAARGTDGRTYPWGENINCNKSNYASGCVGDTTKVGNYKDGESPYAVYDVAGNVLEWVNDWYSETYYQDSPESNPMGPNLGTLRMLRGGSWYGSEYGARTTFRSGLAPDYFYFSIGFRCARSVP